MKVLVAEDDPISRRLLEATLRRWGHEVEVTVNGSQALHALQRPDAARVAVVDWMMPNLDGLEVCRRVRERAVPYVYVILLTAKDRREDLLQGLDAGADDFLVKPFDTYELQARLRTGKRIIDLQQSLLEAQDALRDAASRDGLTTLWNRGTILDRLAREKDRSQREGTAMAVMLVDVDHFKRVNDSYGHQAGDRVLREVAFRLRQHLRTYDEVGRYGGEEFLAVLPGCGEEAATALAERLRALLAGAPIPLGGIELAVTASFGVAATADGASPSAEALLRVADAALFRAKQGGRDRVAAASHERGIAR